MPRRIIKEEIADAEWNSGALLSVGERFQTDAEWHGETLEDIELKLDNIDDSLRTISENIEALRYNLEENKKPIILEKTVSQPMATWRFIVSWVFTLLIFMCFIAAI